MSQIKLLLCAALISFVYLNDSVVWGCSTTNNRGTAHRYEEREYNNTRRTSCGVGLCSYSPNYPYSAINDTVNQYQLILKTYPREDQHKFIDPEVLQYHVKPKQNAGGFITADGCTQTLNTTQPLEGISVDGNRTYYIVNIPSFQQWEQLTECYSSETGKESSRACKPIYRTRKLLVLPADRKQFVTSDLKIEKFKVPYDCYRRRYDDDNEKNNV